jgi:hypothetical protein
LLGNVHDGFIGRRASDGPFSSISAVEVAMSDRVEGSLRSR